jgi:uncharacterized protein YyaL (SSP411 family)
VIPNRLIYEKSPYLRQHAYNPVDWYPWNESAFEKAKKESKPIFLSIGYSTCHWCHVMGEESFEDKEVADILNNHFISIKVDREERPDIDNIYMKVCYLFNGRGGWPLTIIMTPDKKPFFANTYIPKEDMYGKMGLKSLLYKVIELWDKDRTRINEISESITQALKNLGRNKEEIELSEEILHRAYNELKDIFDSHFGGFGISPKFPVPVNLMFLHRYNYRFKNSHALEISLQTLKKMRLGGIYDHIGYGFHRYSTDRFWILPHFEKMLYDNALLMAVYTEAYQITKEEFYKDVVNEITNYLIRDMYSQEGAFYSAEDADSEGKEGEFYLWEYDEIKSLLTDEEFTITENIYNVSKDGNFYEEATRKKNGKNILYMGKNMEELSQKLNVKSEKLKDILEKIRKKLFNKRQCRVRPLRDEKILTDWNALAVLAFTKAGTVFNSKKHIQIAKKCLNFILKRMFDKSNRLLHRYKDEEASIFGYLEDYAYLIWALIDFYFSNFDATYLIKALELTEHAIKHFWDIENKGFYQIADYSEKVILKAKEIYDGAQPSGNSVMAYNLVRLARLTGNNQYENKAIETLKAFSKEISNHPSSYVFSLIALDLILNGTNELLVVPYKSAKEEKIFLNEIQRDFIPDLLILIKESISEKFISRINELRSIDEKSTYYICRKFTCEAPCTEKNKIKNLLLNA